MPILDIFFSPYSLFLCRLLLVDINKFFVFSLLRVMLMLNYVSIRKGILVA